ncbi:hypothetical protein JYT57_00840 [Nitrosarchaeum koreense]|nr:hypothetical protein [Nitrosarchaeum koreense]
MTSGKFVTSICCMDGRIQLPVDKWIKENYSADYIDTITEPGMEKRVSEGVDTDWLKTKTNISISKHNSNLIVISAHHGCAGNPVSKEEQVEQVKKSVTVIKSWNVTDNVIGIYVNDKWEIEEVKG